MYLKVVCQLSKLMDSILVLIMLSLDFVKCLGVLSLTYTFKGICYSDLYFKSQLVILVIQRGCNNHTVLTWNRASGMKSHWKCEHGYSPIYLQEELCENKCRVHSNKGCKKRKWNLRLIKWCTNCGTFNSNTRSTHFTKLKLLMQRGCLIYTYVVLPV